MNLQMPSHPLGEASHFFLSAPLVTEALPPQPPRAVLHHPNQAICMSAPRYTLESVQRSFLQAPGLSRYSCTTTRPPPVYHPSRI